LSALSCVPARNGRAFREPLIDSISQPLIY
jgi:hypothetical protein